MAASWVKVYTSDQLFSAEMIRGMLHEEDIKSIIMNKQDSAYGLFGEIEVYVDRDDVIQALHIIQKHKA